MAKFGSERQLWPLSWVTRDVPQMFHNTPRRLCATRKDLAVFAHAGARAERFLLLSAQPHGMFERTEDRTTPLDEEYARNHSQPREVTMTIQDIIRDSVGAFLRGIGEALPNILAAILILLIGWVIARIFRAAVGRGLRLVKFPTLAERAGIEGFLARGAVKTSSTDVVAVLVYWLVMLIVVVTAVNALGLEVASQLLNQILLYIPNIIVAVIVLAVGLYAASFVAALVRTAAANAGIAEAGLVAAISRYALIIFTFAIALNQLRIGQQIVANGFLILFGAACVAAALAVGLGARDVVGRYLEERFGKK